MAMLGLAWVVDGRLSFDPPWLVTPLNTFFLTVVSMASAALAVRAYRRTGVGAILAIGTGMTAMAIGGGALAAYLLFAVSSNAAISVHNTTALIGAACHLGAAIAGISGIRMGPHRDRHIVLAYGGVAVVVLGWVALVLSGRTPTFYGGGEGTFIRSLVAGTGAALFAGTAFSWWQVSMRDRSIRFLHWYVPGLALFAVALTGVLVGPVGSVTNWIARVGQYLGSVYLFIAVARETLPLVSTRRPSALGVSLLQAGLPFRPLVESTSDAVVALGLHGETVFWNEAAVRRFGVTADEAFDRDPLPLLTPAGDAGREARRRLRELLESEDGGGRRREVRAELTLCGREAGAFPADVAVFANPEDTRLRVLVITDVSERVRSRDELERRVEERTAELRQLNAELERANAAKDEFLGLVSHELKTPITTILAAATVLERNQAAADPNGLLRDLAAESSRLARIVDNLLALARLDAGRDPEREPVALVRLAGHVADLVTKEFDGRQVRVTGDPGAIVDANGEQLAMVIHNYLVNALKYSPAREPVDVAVHERDGRVRLEVLDRGVGIAETDADVLFQPFYRGAATTASPGIGIGLAVCRRIVESLGGTVSAARRAGGGSVFAFQLPTDDALLEPAEDAEDGSEDAPARSRNAA